MTRGLKQGRGLSVIISLAIISIALTASLTLSQTTSDGQEVDPLGFTSTDVDSVGVLLDINSRLRLRLDYALADLEYAQTMLGIKKEPWYVVAWKSEPVRWLVFLAGVWLGAYASS